MADTAIHGRRNLIINGAMQVAQRGTSAASSNSLYPTDRWRTYSSTSDYSMQQYTMTQSDVNSTGQTKGLRVTLSTAETPIGSNNYVSVVTKLEGQDLQQLKYGGSSAKTITLSFWAKSNKTGTYTIWLQTSSDGTNQRIIKEYSINSSDTWEYKTISIVGNTANNIVDTNGLGLQVGFNFAWGSTYNGGTADTWFNTSDGHFSTSNQVNFMDNTSNEFIFTGVQLEVGEQATPFEHRSFGEELALCQRYYEKSYEYGTASGTNTGIGSLWAGGGVTGATTSFLGGLKITYRTIKRGATAVTMYDTDGNSGKIHRFQLGTVSSANNTATVGNNGTTGFTVYSSGGASASGIQGHFEADSEL